MARARCSCVTAPALRAAHEATAAYLAGDAAPGRFLRSQSAWARTVARVSRPARLALGQAVWRGAPFARRLPKNGELALDAWRRVAALPHIVIDAPPELSLFAFHVTWPGRDPRGGRRRDAQAARKHDEAGSRDADRLHGARQVSRTRVRVELPHAPAAHRSSRGRSVRVDS